VFCAFLFDDVARIVLYLSVSYFKVSKVGFCVFLRNYSGSVFLFEKVLNGVLRLHKVNDLECFLSV
jgi:hypothetical protein